MRPATLGRGRALAVIVTASIAVAACTRPTDEAAGTDPTDPSIDRTTTVATTTSTTSSTTSVPVATTAVPTTAVPTTTSSTTSSTSTTTSSTTTVPEDTSPASIYDVRPRSNLPAPPLPAGWGTETIGTSGQGRDITALVRIPPSPRHRVVVIGGLHGNEPVTPPTVRGLVEASIPDDVAVWLVPEANPDGSAVGTRWNGDGVDLNRNFSWGWSEVDGGPAPLSEPETQALTDLIGAVDPTIVVWVHQPYGYVSSIGETDPAFEQAWSNGSGTPVRSGVTQHGGGESWTAFVAGHASMLIEIGSWNATEEITAAQRGGFEALVAALDQPTTP